MMNLTDISGRLVRWRLRLLDFNFTVHYKKCAKKNIADKVSRLATEHDTMVQADLDIPVYWSNQMNWGAAAGTRHSKG